MNNILQSVISTAEFYSLFKDQPEKLKKLGNIEDVVKLHVRRGVNLIKNVRKLSKLDEEEAKLGNVEVSEVLKNSIDHITNSFQEKSIEINLSGFSETMTIVGNDLVVDIFDNILNNAVKFNDNEEKIQIDINT